MNQGEFTGVFCARPQNFAWFLGAGTSRSAGLPTAIDIMWDMKRRHYCQEENQDISRQDIQNQAVKDRIQSFMESRGFPPLWSDGEYSAYFEKIFGADKERQRKYLKAILSEENVRLSVGSRVLGALLSSGLSRAAFTTNFDSVVEKALAEVGKQSLAAYHLEGSHAAIDALNNEEFPLYCKLHGDFRYDSLKNLPADLAAQNANLSQCMVNAGNRFGFVVAGYSGRDASITALFHSVLDSHNPFPHGLFWTGIKGATVPQAVENLLAQARAKGVNAHYVGIETFDALLLRLWRNIDPKPAALDALVRKSQTTAVHIPLPPPGTAKPIMRLNALPIVSMPTQCQSLAFNGPKEWDDLRRAERETRHGVILTKSDSVWCWGLKDRIRQAFGDTLTAIATTDMPADLTAPGNQHFKGFLESALCAALARGKPVFSRTTRSAAFLIADPRPEARALLRPLFDVVGATTGIVSGLLAPPTDEHKEPEKVTWSEALRLSVDFKDGRAWLLIEPDIWIWPSRARESAVAFLNQRRGDRYNIKYNRLLDAWIRVILGDERDAEVTVRPFDGGSDSENPLFTVATRTGFSRRLTS